MKRSPMPPRSAPMKRPGIDAKPKPSKGPRPKKCANRACRQPYLPDPKQPFKNWCGDDCALAIALDKLAKQKATKARAERAEHKKALEKHKRRADYIAEAQRAFNSFIRERDKDKPCICCGRADTKVEGLNTHGWDCGHYRSRGSAPHLRFDERNAHRQLVYCNRHGAGRAADYRIGLIARIGLAEVEALECDQADRPQSVDDLIAIRAHYVAKLKELKAENARNSQP